jgi:hypothetical protein
LQHCDWSDVCVHVAVASLRVAVQDDMEQTILRGYNRKSKFPPWFSNALRYFIVKKNYSHSHLKKKRSDYFYDKFAFTENLLKTLSGLTGLDG